MVMLPSPYWSLSATSTLVSFAHADAHLDHDEIRLADLLVPRPASSYVYRVRGSEFGRWGIFQGDIAIIERALPLKAGRIALVSVDGTKRLAKLLRLNGRLTFADIPTGDVAVDVIGVATRILRVLVP